MSIKSLLVSRWLLSSAVLVLLSACNSSYFSVKKSELVALEQCQQAQQSQQHLILQQQTRLDETLVLLQENLELQKRQLETPPPEPVAPAAAPQVVCPKPIQPPPLATNPQTLFPDKQLVGERERILLTSIDVLLRARINTGVTTSQIDARNIQMFERNGEEWVRFTVVDRATDTMHELERKRLRYIQTSKVDESTRRPVVELRITIGKLTQTAEFILADRSGQAYPFLIGRNVLRDVMLVDVSRSDLAPVVREPKETSAPANADKESDKESAKEPVEEKAQP